MVRLEFARRLGEGHDDRIDGRQHDLHEDHGHRQADEEAHGKDRAVRLGSERRGGPSGDLRQEHAEKPRHGADDDRHQREAPVDQIVGDDVVPPLGLEELDDLLSRRNVIKAVEANVAVAPSVEVPGEAGQKTEDALEDAQQEPAPVLPPGPSRQRFQSLDDRHQQAPHADAPEAVGRGASEGVDDRGGEDRQGVLRGKPPGSDHTADGNVQHVLKDLNRPVVGQAQQSDGDGVEVGLADVGVAGGLLEADPHGGQDPDNRPDVG
mmetsp:Transcript_13993/g.32548  ORF Transcript_13993/g.32548 Transcript_13993/m.32548 type:complete len:265 (+) Transcript_13993:493-1287(+)